MKENVGGLKDCFGCGTCGSVCPQNIINIKEVNGFLQPVITDIDKCTECGICLRICSYYNKENIVFPENILNAYAARNTDLDIIKDSSSGGVSTGLIERALLIGMDAIGVRYNTQTDKPEHYIISSEAEALQARGSKYLQSDISKAIKGIDWNKKYLVIGTPCQIASFRLYVRLRKKENNFIFVDFFCHGVPSYKLWRSYLKMNKIKPRTIERVKFRTKDCGWQSSTKIGIKARERIVIPDPKKKDIFFGWFLGDRCLSKACYDSCKFKQINSVSDIRIGDLWGKDFANDEIGVSGIITLSQRGEDFLNSCKNISKDEVRPEVILGGQMKKNAKRAKSYTVANFGLRYDIPLALTNFVCNVIDNVYAFPKRLKKKIGSMWKR